MEREQQHRIPIDGPRWHRKRPRRRRFGACRRCYSCYSHQDAMGAKPKTKRHPRSSLRLRSSKPPLPPWYRQPRSRASPSLLLLPRFVATYFLARIVVCYVMLCYVVGPIAYFYVKFSWQSPERKKFVCIESKELRSELTLGKIVSKNFEKQPVFRAVMKRNNNEADLLLFF